MGVGDRHTDNDQMPNLNRIWTAPNVEDVTINVVTSGTETDSVKFLNKGQSGTGYSIVADQDIELVALSHGGTTMLVGDPIQIAINIRRTRAVKQPNFTQMVIRVLTANTTIQLEVF